MFDANELIEKQIENLVSDFKRTKFLQEIGKNWDRFYNRNGNRFFKVI